MENSFADWNSWCLTNQGNRRPAAGAKRCRWGVRVDRKVRPLSHSSCSNSQDQTKIVTRQWLTERWRYARTILDPRHVGPYRYDNGAWACCRKWQSSELEPQVRLQSKSAVPPLRTRVAASSQNNCRSQRLRRPRQWWHPRKPRARDEVGGFGFEDSPCEWAA